MKNITGYTSDGNASAIVNWAEPSASDNSGNQTLTSSHESGTFFPIGTTVVHYTSTDPSGNRVTETMNIIVIQRKMYFVCNLALFCVFCNLFLLTWFVFVFACFLLFAFLLLPLFVFCLGFYFTNIVAWFEKKSQML